MDRLDPATASHIVEETPEILPAEATQWILEDSVPFITHRCARTNVGEGEYIHKQRVRQPSSGLQRMKSNSLPVACRRLCHVDTVANRLTPVRGPPS